MSNGRKTKPDIKLKIGFVVAVLALMGGIAATFISGNSQEPNKDESTFIVEKDTPTEEEVNYDSTELKSRIEEVEELYTRFSTHINDKYGSSATKIDFTNDQDAQTILGEFIVAIDGLDQTIVASPYSDLKDSWKEFRDSFDKRREYITSGIDETKDGDWAQKLFSVYFLIMSKVEL